MKNGEARMLNSSEAKDSGKRRSKGRLLVILLVILIAVPILLSVFFYNPPMSDFEAKVVSSDRYYKRELDRSYIVIIVNATNNGSSPEKFSLTGSVVFSTEPDTTFTEASGTWGPINPGDSYPDMLVLVSVPNELLQDNYDASVSVESFPFSNEKTNIGFIVITGIIWLVVLAAVVTALVRARHGNH